LELMADNTKKDKDKDKDKSGGGGGTGAMLNSQFNKFKTKVKSMHISVVGSASNGSDSNNSDSNNKKEPMSSSFIVESSSSKKSSSVTSSKKNDVPVLAIAIDSAEKKESEKDPEEQAVKLVHLTADRPKGPPGRRAPPSRKPVAERQVAVVESEPPPGGFKEPVLVREKPSPKPPPTATSLVIIRIDVEDEHVRQITMKKTAVVADAFISLKKKLPEKKNDTWSLTMIINGKETDVPYSSEQFLIELITCDPKDVKFKFKNVTPPKPPLDPEVLEEMKRDLLREHEMKKKSSSSCFVR